MMNIEEFVNENDLFDGHYALIRPLSVDGATADVWLALDTNTVTEEVQLSEVARLTDNEIEQLGLMVAIKIYRPQNALDIEGKQKFTNEFMIVFNCHHTNLIHPMHFSIFRETPYLVLPYCKSGSSEVLIGNLNNEKDIWKYIGDVAAGLAYLHCSEPPIIHQDIKPANVLIDDMQNYAITDFGISAQRGGSHRHYDDDEKSGTMAYMAPERFEEDTLPLPQSDIWAFGATLYELITGNPPFGENGGLSQKENSLICPKVKGVPTCIQRLLRSCLDIDPAKRPTAPQLVEAAMAHRYSVKKKDILKYGLIAAISILTIGMAIYYLKLQTSTTEQKPKIEDLYKKALYQIDYSKDSATIVQGFKTMDSLSSVGYIPATFQMARTYGWFSECKPRKQFLGIKFDDKGSPKTEFDKEKALEYIHTIIESNDSAFPSETGEAYYQIGVYYTEKTHLGVEDLYKAKSAIEIAYSWSKMTNNSNLKNNADIAIKRINDEIQKHESNNKQ